MNKVDNKILNKKVNELDDKYINIGESFIRALIYLDDVLKQLRDDNFNRIEDFDSYLDLIVKEK